MANKLKDWKSKHQKLKDKFREFEKEYREKNYSNLTETQKKKRNYRIIDGKEYCDYMIKARTNFFKKQIEGEFKEFVKLQDIKYQENNSIQISEPQQLDLSNLFEKRIQKNFSS